MVSNLFPDLRFAARTLIRQPGFSVVVVLTLALGIGTNAAIFAIVDHVLLRPFPFKDPDNVMVVWTDRPGVGTSAPFSMADFLDLEAEQQSFETVAVSSNKVFNLTGVEAPDRIRGAAVSGDFFATLGVSPIMGRTMVREEEQPDATRLVVISERFWRSRFGSDPQVVGRTLTLDGSIHSVIGVMPDSFRYPQTATDVWTNLTVTPPSVRTPYFLRGLARLN